MKTSFVIGSLGSGANVLMLAEESGLLDTPVHILFTVVVGFVLMACGGVSMLLVNKWIGKLSDKIGL